LAEDLEIMTERIRVHIPQAVEALQAKAAEIGAVQILSRGNGIERCAAWRTWGPDRNTYVFAC